MSSKPTLTIAMIVRDCADLLPRCLDSLKSADYDQLVIVLGGPSKDNTRRIAKKYTKEVYVWPDWNPKEIGPDYDGMNHFGECRNFSFSKAKSDWILWIDSDDVLENGETIKPYLASLSDEIGALWNTYFYAHDANGNCITFFDRERLLRRDLNWKWRNRVHEVAEPETKTGHAHFQGFTIRHKPNEPMHRGPRNLSLLKKSYEENPEDRRVWMYLGYQLFHEKLEAEAVRWFQRFFTDEKVTELDRYSAMIYCSKAYRNMNEIPKAIEVLFNAMKTFPQFYDAYYDLAACYIALKNYQRAQHWLDEAENPSHQIPPRFILVNPMDYTFNPLAMKTNIAAGMGQLEKALDYAEEALKIAPDHEDLLKNVEIYQQNLDEMEQANSFASITHDMTDKQLVQTWRNLNGSKAIPEIRDLVMPIFLKKRGRGTQPRVHFWCGQTIEPFGPNAIEKGIGGSETALIKVANHFNEIGWRVDIFGRPETDEGEHDGIGWWEYNRWRDDLSSDLFVSWRAPHIADSFTDKQDKRLLWCHDLNFGDSLSGQRIHSFNHIAGVSAWHRDYLERAYGHLSSPTEAWGYLPNGVDLGRFTQAIKRQSFKVVWSSSWDRGLLTLLTMWPFIIQIEPKAELHIFYGDKLLRWWAEGGNKGAAQHLANIEARMDTPNTFWRGRIPQDELAQEFLSAEAWFYPTNFLEVFCISALEAMAAGATPVASRIGALPWILGDCGELVKGYPSQPHYQKEFLGRCFLALLDTETKQHYRKAGPERARLFTWDEAFKHWDKVIAGTPELVKTG